MTLKASAFEVNYIPKIVAYNRLRIQYTFQTYCRPACTSTGWINGNLVLGLYIYFLAFSRRSHQRKSHRRRSHRKRSHRKRNHRRRKNRRKRERKERRKERRKEKRERRRKVGGRGDYFLLKELQWNLIITVTLGPSLRLAGCYIEVVFLLSGIQNHHN